MKNGLKRTLIWTPISVVLVFIVILTVIPIVVSNSMLNRKVEYSQVWVADSLGIKADTLNLKTSDDFSIRVYSVVPDTAKASVICLTGI